MKQKKLIYGGLIIFASTIIIGILGTVWGIHASFEALRTNQSAGVGAVGAGIESALFFTIFSMIGLLTGLILIVVGIVKQRSSKSAEK